jgi:Arc/MetJ family transcription regulator
MRTNIVLDDELVAEAMRRTGIKTKRAVVEEALRTLIGLKRQEEILGVARQAPLGGRSRPDAPRLSRRLLPTAISRSRPRRGHRVMGWTRPADGNGVPGWCCQQPRTPVASMAGSGKQTVARRQTGSDRS